MSRVSKAVDEIGAKREALRSLLQTLVNERLVVNSIVNTNEPGLARLSPAPARRASLY